MNEFSLNPLNSAITLPLDQEFVQEELTISAKSENSETSFQTAESSPDQRCSVADQIVQSTALKCLCAILNSRRLIFFIYGTL